MTARRTGCASPSSARSSTAPTGRGGPDPAGDDEGRRLAPGPGLEPQVLTDADHAAAIRIGRETSTSWRSRNHDRTPTPGACGTPLQLRRDAGRRLAHLTLPCGRSAHEGRAPHPGRYSRRPGQAAARAPSGSHCRGRREWARPTCSVVRRIVQREGGYFFLVDLTTGAAFWEDVAEAMRSELLQDRRRGRPPADRAAAAVVRQGADVARPGRRGGPRRVAADRR